MPYSPCSTPTDYTQTYANTCMQCMQIVVGDLIPQVSHTWLITPCLGWMHTFVFFTQDSGLYNIYCNLNKLHMVSN